MIRYEVRPISQNEASRVKAWLASPDAQLFKECVESQMHQHFFDAVNSRCKPADDNLNLERNEGLAEQADERGAAICAFLDKFRDFADPDTGFFKLKIN